jgi:hypothetical protein
MSVDRYLPRLLNTCLVDMLHRMTTNCGELEQVQKMCV